MRTIKELEMALDPDEDWAHQWNLTETVCGRSPLTVMAQTISAARKARILNKRALPRPCPVCWKKP